MVPYDRKPTRIIQGDVGSIASFCDASSDANIDWATVDAFGEEWTRFPTFDEGELRLTGDQYFDIVGSDMLVTDSQVLDVGCGGGRWTRYLAMRAGFIEAVDPSHAVFSAQASLADLKNVRLTQAGVDELPFPDESFDFVFSLGVLHHIPDTKAAMRRCVEKLKPGGYFLVYLYYDLANRSRLFRSLFECSTLVRHFISRLPRTAKHVACEVIAFSVYLPLVTVVRLMRRIPDLGSLAMRLPLAYYWDKSLRIIRNDALDRFGTPLEQRFSREEIRAMMLHCGLDEIVFSEQPPFWHAVGRKRS